METISMDNYPIQLDYHSEIEMELQFNTKTLNNILTKSTFAK